MPRKRVVSSDEVLHRATALFWRQGYEATSVEDLVRATGANRAGLYGAFTGKRGLFLRALDHYRDGFVGRALAGVEASGASIAAIRAYFDALIDLDVQCGLPGSGCLMANSMTEVAPQDDEVQARVRAHFDRLRRGFTGALSNARSAGELPAWFDTASFGHFLAVAAQGLWVFSRICDDQAELRGFVTTMLAPLAGPFVEEADSHG
jgi:TetR/AcrR family transcriptional repressor of nem operon